MRLSKRLTRVAANVRAGGVVADIGCDHGFTCIELLQEKRVTYAIASDVKKEPLLRAWEHMIMYGLSDRMEVRLADGLSGIQPDEADTILISGMGGALMARILTEGKAVAQSAKELVLSPQSEIFCVRRCIHSLGFRVDAEEMLFEAGKYYVILHAIPGTEAYETEAEYRYGKRLMEAADPIFIRFMQTEQRRVKRLSEKLSKEKLSEKGRERMAQLLEERDMILSVLGGIQERKGNGR